MTYVRTLAHARTLLLHYRTYYLLRIASPPSIPHDPHAHHVSHRPSSIVIVARILHSSLCCIHTFPHHTSSSLRFMGSPRIRILAVHHRMFSSLAFKQSNASITSRLPPPLRALALARSLSLIQVPPRSQVARPPSRGPPASTAQQ